MHPVPPDLAKLNDMAIEQKITQLNKIYFITENESVRHQIILLIDTYKIELEERRAAARKKQDQNKNDLDSLIKVT
jgi:hypothetical protein